jgi:arylsulfatase A-like enzyme
MSVRPNVVVIVSDTFRRDHLGAYGNPNIHTPYLDEFARSSVVFDGHVISSFPTMPARADILTGSFSYTFMGWEPLPSGLQTLPGLLSRAGYLTMGIVDTPFFVRGGYGYDRGFDDFVWVRGQGDDTRPQERSDYRATWRSESDRLVARTVTEAEHWLERHYKENFFLYVDTWDPHEPWDAPEYYTAMYRPGYEGRQLYPSYGNWEEAGLTRDDIDLAHAMYCGEVTMVDFWMGRLLAKLDVLGLRDNTIIFFLSDHGFYFGEHGYFGKAEWINDNWATVTEGTTVASWLPESWLLTVGWSPLYQELTRVPLIVHAPGLTPGHRQALTTAPDLAPTILELAGVERPSAMQGIFLGRPRGRRRAPALRRKLLAALLRGGRDNHRGRFEAAQDLELHADHHNHVRQVGDPGWARTPARALRPDRRLARRGERVGVSRPRGQGLVRGCDLFPRRTGDVGRPPGAEAQGRRELRARPLGLQENRAVPGMVWASSW